MLSVAAYRLVTLAVMACLLSEAHALDPHRQFSQYVREKWSAANGLPGGAVHAIAQSPDGYLWIGTDKGLVRFDGFTFLPVQPKSLLLQNDPILGLTTDAEGDLWVRMQTAGVLGYNRGRFENLASGANATVTQVTALARDNAAGMLLSDLISGTLRLRNGKLDLVAPASILPGSPPTMSIAETAAGGKIWLGTLGAGLFSLENGRATSTRVHLLVRSRRLSESMSEYLIGRIEGHPRIEIHYLSQIVGLSGTAHLENVEWRDDTLGANITRAIRHVFVMAGAAPHAEWLEDFFVLDKSGFIATGSDLAQYTNFHWQLQRNPFLLETSVPGIFAVGDARSGSVKRVASAVGEGSMAVHLVHRFLAECEEQLAVESTPQLMAERTPV